MDCYGLPWIAIDFHGMTDGLVHVCDMDCHGLLWIGLCLLYGLPWIAMNCHELPWIAMDWSKFASLVSHRFSSSKRPQQLPHLPMEQDLCGS